MSKRGDAYLRTLLIHGARSVIYRARQKTNQETWLHKLIALTSLTHTQAVPALHPGGRRLADLADAVLDNCAPAGDALLPLPGGGTLCGVSTLTSALLVQMTVAEAVGLLTAEGGQAPVYISANLPGGHERNTVLERRYAGRLHRGGF